MSQQQLNLNDIDAISNLLASRIIAISDQDTPERDPLNPDAPRLMSFPLVDCSPISFKGYTSLKALCTDAQELLRANQLDRQAKGDHSPGVYISPSVEDDSSIITLRAFSFTGLSDNGEGYFSSQITRRRKVRARKSFGQAYGRGIATPAQTPAEATATAPGETAKTKPGLV